MKASNSPIERSIIEKPVIEKSATEKPEAVNPVVLITGASRRIGRAMAEYFHQRQYNVAIHYRSKKTEAFELCETLNKVRAESAICLQADLSNIAAISDLADQAQAHWQRVDVLINNASSFYPTPFATSQEAMDSESRQKHWAYLQTAWHDLMNSNAQAPFFLSIALKEALEQQQGCIINIADIHGQKPMKHHSIYSMAKAANIMLTQSLAKDLAPKIRVNGIAPGAILWPENAAELNEKKQQEILEKIALQKSGNAEEIAKTAYFMAAGNQYITGQVLAVDGGRSLNL